MCARWFKAGSFLSWKLCVCRGRGGREHGDGTHDGILTGASLSHVYIFVFLDICLYRDSVRRIPNRPVRPVRAKGDRRFGRGI